jgi:putative MFS transporter
MAGQGDADRLVARIEGLPFSRWHWKLATVAAFAVLFDAADFALFGAALPPMAKEFGFGPAQAGLLAMAGLVGAAVGALFCGTVSDYVGRKRTFIVTTIVFSVFTALTSFSWNIPSLLVFRIIANIGLGGMIPISLTIVSEFMPTAIRGRTSSWVQAAFPIGLALAAGLSLYMLPRFGWRMLFLTGLAPIILVFFAQRYMHESVRYLVSRGNLAKAEQIVDQIGRESGITHIAQTPSLRADVAKGRSITVSELLASEYRRRTILLWIVSFCFFWSANGLLFMLPTILTQRGIPLSQAISYALVQGVFGFFGYVTCGDLIDRFGRRPVLFLYYLIGAGFHLWFAIATGVWMYVAIAFVGWVNPGAYGPTGVYAGELYPTHIRATAVGWFFGIGRIGSFLAPAVVGFMLHAGYGRYVLQTFALSYLIAGIAVVLVGKETRGLALEQIRGSD